MPSFSDLPALAADRFDAEFANKYNSLPYYLVPLESRRFVQWQTFNQLFGTINWKPNMGPIMRGVRIEPTPKIRQQFYPNPIQTAPKRDVFETLETSADAILKRHFHDSKQINFLPEFQDFLRHLSFLHTDISEQIVYAGECFAASVALQRAPMMYICGNKDGTGNCVPAPFIPNNVDITTATVGAQGKATAYFADLANKIGDYAKLKYFHDAVIRFERDLGAVPFEGGRNMPKDNEILKGKYAYVGDGKPLQQIPWDDDFARFRNMNTDIIQDGWQGSIFGKFTFKSMWKPLRFLADGTFPEPEIISASTNETIPNPQYAAAPFSLGFFFGADMMDLIKIGPPPREFAQKSIDEQKFRSMRWNGEIQLTDDFLLKDSDGNFETNNRGEFVKLQSGSVYGAITRKNLHCMMFAYANRNLA